MRRILATALLAAAALTPATAHAAADGCVTHLLQTDDPSLDPVVTLNPDGSVTVDPNPVTGLALRQVAKVVVLVDCIV
ncbi:MAG TPA: hypothetical protein VGX28_06840 [Frankiaceae bacterium]|jgi:hypothetical protein|nr:hypothetical protein [Frankiaceae bacterium]